MIKLKPFLAVLTVLGCMAAFFTLSAWFPVYMFSITMTISVIAICVSVYKIADKHYNREEE